MSDVVKKYMYLALKINHTVECAQKHDANSFFMIFFYVWKIQLILEDLIKMYLCYRKSSFKKWWGPICTCATNISQRKWLTQRVCTSWGIPQGWSPSQIVQKRPILNSRDTLKWVFSMAILLLCLSRLFLR